MQEKALYTRWVDPKSVKPKYTRHVFYPNPYTPELVYTRPVFNPPARTDRSTENSQWLNILDRYLIFQEFYEDWALQCEYVVNGHKYNIGYFLSDGSYPRRATFSKTIPIPQGPKVRLFAEWQEAVRKDVERAFGFLQSWFAVIHDSTRNIDKAELGIITKACIIPHNMIFKDERDSYDLAFDYDYVEDSTPEPNVGREHHPCYAAYLRRVVQVCKFRSSYTSPIRFDARNMEAAYDATRIAIVIVMYFLVHVMYCNRWFKFL